MPYIESPKEIDTSDLNMPAIILLTECLAHISKREDYAIIHAEFGITNNEYSILIQSREKIKDGQTIEFHIDEFAEYTIAYDVDDKNVYIIFENNGYDENIEKVEDIDDFIIDFRNNGKQEN